MALACVCAPCFVATMPLFLSPALDGCECIGTPITFGYCKQCNWKVCPACNIKHATGTILHIAARLNASAEVLCRLLDVGGRALLEAKDSSGKTARQLAVSQNSTIAVAEIDRWTEASFMQAAGNNDLSTIKRLLSANQVDIRTQDAEGCTALHHAAKAGHANVVLHLVDKGGQRLVVMTNKRRETAMDLALLQHVLVPSASEPSAVVATLDSQMQQLQSSQIQSETDLKPTDRFERKYLAKYEQEQAQLRENASTLLAKARQVREEYRRLITDHASSLPDMSLGAGAQVAWDSFCQMEKHDGAIGTAEEQLRVANQELSAAMPQIYKAHRDEQKRLQGLRDRLQSLKTDYSRTYNEAEHLINPQEYEELATSLLMSGTASDAGQKFLSDPNTLITGEFEHAAGGIGELLSVDEDDLAAQATGGVDAMRAEIAALGNAGLTQHFDYIVNEVASEMEFPQGIRDKGRAGMRLVDFCNTPQALAAALKLAEAAAMRVYTSPAFDAINNPLRDQTRFREKRPHPLAVTVLFIVRGLKKLRKFGASDDSATQTQVLWRGMKNLRITDEFARRGGTELAPMSTTDSFGVAVEYSRCPGAKSLIFKIVTENKLQRGAGLEWISLFPNESEVLFPPLTYMQPTGKTQVVEIDGFHFTIVEVRTTAGA